MTTVEERLPINFNKVKKSYTLYGASGSALWMIPVVNLFAPILVCASIFHAMAKECTSVPKSLIIQFVPAVNLEEDRDVNVRFATCRFQLSFRTYYSWPATNVLMPHLTFHL